MPGRWKRLTLIALVLSLLAGNAAATDWFGGGGGGHGGGDEIAAEKHAYATFAAGPRLELQMTEDTGCLRIKDAQSGAVWRSWEPGELTGEMINGYSYIGANVESALMLTCFKKKATEAVAETVYSAESAAVTLEKLDGGVKAFYQFAGFGITIAVRYTLENDALAVDIAAGGIREEGDYLLISVSLLPWFGSGGDTDEGYVLIPDGSGAVINFKESHPSYAGGYQEAVFSRDTVTVERDVYSNKKGIMLPVFGISRNGGALICDIREGAEDTNLVCQPSGYRVNITSIYPQFILRREYAATLANAATVRKFETSPLKQDFRAVYTFLGKGKTTYGDMANRYRLILTEAGALNTAAEFPVMALTLFMAAQQTRVLRNKYIPVTTFEQGGQLLAKLKGAGAESLMVNVMGWTDKGYGAWPNRFPVPGGIGGSGGSKAFNAFAAENGIPVYYTDNYLDADSAKANVSMRNVVYQGNRVIAETDKSGGKYLFTPRYAAEAFRKNLGSYGKIGVTGLAFEGLGDTVYHDYNPYYGDMTRRGAAAIWRGMLERWKKTGGRAAVQGGNAYLLALADWLYDIPADDTGYFFRDETVPFYQMVVHGSIPYTGTPVNIFSDASADLLKMVEYGYTPLFTVSHDDPEKLVESDYNRLFSSRFADLESRLLAIYGTYENKLSGISSAVMTSHEKLAPGVFCTTYGNGKRVYVNYGAEAWTKGNLTVNARDFAVE